MRAANIAMIDERTRRAEREESASLRQRALEVAKRTETVDAKIDRMNRIYRERLVGNRGVPE